MREVKYYVAWDDSEFDNREECEEYESEAMDFLNEIFNIYLFFDEHFQEFDINLAEVNEGIEEGLDIFQWVWDNCTLIRVKQMLSDEARKFIDCYFGYAMPPNELGMYEYDFKKLEWVKVDE